MVILKEITLKNFKSFKGETKIDCVLPFTVILGCNGAGKSNLVDAISFAMGVKTNSLRASKTEELVHRSHSGVYQHDMLVTVSLQSLDGSVMSFTRSFEQSSSGYRINHEVVSYNDYVSGLGRLDINPRVKNFLVLQNSIEAVVMINPVARAKIFADISGSTSFATEYNRLQSLLLQFNRELQSLKQTERSISRGIKGLLYCKMKAREHRELGNKYETAHINLTLFNLYYIEHNTRRFSDMLKDKTAKMLALEIEKHAAEEQLKDITAPCKRDKYDASVIESKIREMTMEVRKTAEDITRAETKTQCAHNKVLSCGAALESAKNAVRVRDDSIKELESALLVTEQKKDQYLRRFSYLLERDFQLDQAQIKEYEDLKALSLKKFRENYERLKILERKHDAVEDELESATIRKDEWKNSMDRMIALHLEYKKRFEYIEECEKKKDRELSQNLQSKNKLLESIKSISAKKCSLRKSLEDVRQQINDIEFQEEEQKKKKIVQELRYSYPDVLDRLENIYNMRHNRYNLSVSKVLLPHIHSIIVKTTEAAKICIAHLKECCIETETFIPLDNIHVTPLKQQLRNTNRPNVKLAYDVITFYPEFDRAIQFVTDNTLICESSEDASAIAFHKGDRHSCVSVDGYLYQKSGLISGGTCDLTSKGQRLNSSLKDTLLSRKEKIIDDLRKIDSLLPKESEVLVLESTTAYLKKSLEFIKANLQATVKECSRIEYKIQHLEDLFDASVYTWEEIKSKKDQALDEIEQFKVRISGEEDRVFADFCNKIGVDNIRQYAEGQVSFKEQLKSFDSQIYSTKQQLNFQKKCKPEDDVSRWEKKLSEAKREVESFSEQERNKRHLIAEEKKRGHNLEAEHKNIKHRIKTTLGEITKQRAKVRTKAQKYLMCVKEVDELESLITKEKNHRHDILTEAKVRGLKIPLIDGPPNEDADTNDTENFHLPEDESMAVDVSDDSNKYDFSKLPQDLLQLDSDVEISEARKRLEESVADANDAIEALANPNTNASQEIHNLREELQTTKSKIALKRTETRKMNASFECIKKQRRDRFMDFFDFAEEQVDLIYKKLTKKSSAQAILIPENPEEPYLGGIHYHCVVPGKRFQSTSSLSGGEKTLAALPLVFTLQSGKSPPFRVLDEIDAALDNKNAMKVVNYIKTHKNVQQSVVISHKKEFISGADSLVGIASTTTADGTESRILTFDLRSYNK